MHSEKETLMDRSAGQNSAGTSEKARLAVFDFDGTIISENSPHLLAMYLKEKDMLRRTIIMRLYIWAFCYVFHLPQSEAWARSLIFSPFEGWEKERVDRFLAGFCEEKVLPLFRDEAAEEIAARRAEGCKIVVVSATFEPILLRFGEDHPFDYQIAVKMKVDDKGCYTRKVVGIPNEGAEKIRSLRRFADAEFGAGNWELVYSYADHYSDVPILEPAAHPFAVDPDKTLTRYANRKGWEILDW